MAKPLNLEVAHQLVAKKSDAMLRLNISRNMLIAILISLLIHLAFLITVNIKPVEIGSSQPAPITVTLNDVEPPPPPPPPAETPKPEPVKEPVKEVSKPKKIIATQNKSTFKVPVIEAPKEDPKPVTQPKPDPIPVKPVPEVPVIPPGMDMNDYLKAQREKRRIALGLNSKDFNDSVSGKRELTAEEKRDEVIKQNLKKQDLGGAFTVFDKLTYSAKFSFQFNDKRRVYSVETGIGEDLERAIIKQVIAVILQTDDADDGEISWRSDKFGRTFIMSVRPEDQAALEAFLMKEFF